MGEEFMMCSYHTLSIVCRERYIKRRQGLLEHRLSEGDVVNVTSVVERMFDIMKSSAGGSQTSNNRGVSDEYSRTVSMTGEVDSLLLRFSGSLRVEVYIAKKQASEKGSKTKRQNNAILPAELLKMVHNQTPVFVRGEDRLLYGIISIYENDVYTYPEKSPLDFHFTSADSTFSCSMGLPIRMPS